ncbi:PLP-dependent aminotransferase family protein [Cryobacterium sp. PH31-L1]|uniref:MocR-like pyridoxine biosynthesis transcription factor PdxR n=1 Tax=Cryobacterium sp. PH31-L1 TaxID=3046199 RepID=UPI0024BBCCE0|nr:PLP-dependent aminotransferase family protein [Cryobacterium sp. PH31-L1]MDJ0377689.1 PLP-dependent aminotransferase family protein [Cryobacterium sp. PH31-L1]
MPYLPVIALERAGSEPLSAQIVAQMRSSILLGELHVGESVPSTRALAARLGVSRGSVVTAYDQLTGEGYLVSTQGAPTRVAVLVHEGDAALPTQSVVAPKSGPAPVVLDLTPGYPSTRRLSGRAWTAAWRRAAAQPIPHTEPPLQGTMALRTEVAQHLRHARGVLCSIDDIIVTAGTSEALALVAVALQERGGAGAALADRVGRAPLVAVETPGYPAAARVLRRLGVNLVSIPNEADGMPVRALDALANRVDAVLVTPSHQYPLGGRLPVEDRLRLLHWAQRTDAWIIEDDYDSEFRHVGPPLPALASLDNDGRVVLVGSFSKVLTPWLRVGYLVLPERAAVRDALLAVRGDLPGPVSGVVQEAAAALLSSGAVRRHIATARRDYAHRRRLVLESLSSVPGTTLTALDGGLHAVLELADQVVAGLAVSELLRRGIRVADLRDYSAEPVKSAVPAGLVFGYAACNDTALARALDQIRAVTAGTPTPNDGSEPCTAG